MNLPALKSVVMQELLSGLRKEYLYHSAEHTEMVFNSTKLLVEMEGLTEEESLIVQTAGLIHDLGLIIVYIGHEKESVRMAKELLPRYGYDNSQIELICKLILATTMPQTPNDRFENIICDADMFYLGEESYLERSGFLREELKVVGKHYTDKEWYAFQEVFLMNHRFHTDSASKLLDKGKEKNLLLVRQILRECA